VNAIGPYFFMALPLVFLAGVLAWQYQQRKRFVEAFEGDNDYVANASFLQVTVTTRRGQRPATLKPTSTGGKNSTPLWDISVDNLRLARRTTLSLSEEGVFGALRNAIGLKDVQVGDAAFDKRFTIRGSNDDVVRAILARQDVQDAVRDLFEASIWSCNLTSAGRLMVRMRRGSLAADEARQRLALVRRLGDMLDQAADVAALPELPTVGVGSVTASSGVPVGVRGDY
jgi:hypothetical protein